MANQKEQFSQIYDQYINKIYRFVFLKVNSREVAEDLTSQTFLKGWEAFQGQKEIENIQAFLYQIARNLVIDHYREKGQARLVSTEVANSNSPIIDRSEDLEERAFFNSDIGFIKSALTGLNNDYQNVIIWHYLDDLPICEVAKMLDRTEPATRVLLHRALESLRKKVNIS